MGEFCWSSQQLGLDAEAAIWLRRSIEAYRNFAFGPRPPPGRRSLESDPLRPSAHRHWRCHLDCSRAYIGKLETEGVIPQQGDGFPRDRSRVAHLRYLRRERRQSPRSEADPDHVKVKTEMLQLRLMQARRELVGRTDVDELIDQIAGVTPIPPSSDVQSRSQKRPLGEDKA